MEVDPPEGLQPPPLRLGGRGAWATLRMRVVMGWDESCGREWARFGLFLGVCSFTSCLSWKDMLATGCSAARGAPHGDPPSWAMGVRAAQCDTPGPPEADTKGKLPP